MISWIKKFPDSFDDYVNAIDGIWSMADIMSKHTIIHCSNGFLIFVENQDVAFRCAYFEDKKQIQITDMIQ